MSMDGGKTLARELRRLDRMLEADTFEVRVSEDGNWVTYYWPEYDGRPRRAAWSRVERRFAEYSDNQHLLPPRLMNTLLRAEGVI